MIWRVPQLTACLRLHAANNPVRLWSTCSSSSSSLESCTREPPAGWRRSSSERASKSSSSRFASSWAWTAAAQRTWCSRRSESSHLMTKIFTVCCSEETCHLPFSVTLSLFINVFISSFIHPLCLNAWFADCFFYLLTCFSFHSCYLSHLSFCALCDWCFNPSPPLLPHPWLALGQFRGVTSRMPLCGHAGGLSSISVSHSAPLCRFDNATEAVRTPACQDRMMFS